MERSLQSLRIPAAGARGGSFADAAFSLPSPDDADAGGTVQGRRPDGITLSRWTLYAYGVMVPVIAAAAFLLGCWWAATGGR